MAAMNSFASSLVVPRAATSATRRTHAVASCSAAPRASLRAVRCVHPKQGKRAVLVRASENDDDFPEMEIIPKKTEGIGEWREEKFAVIDTGVWECKSCAYEYNESKGDPDFPVAAGTPWKAVPDDYNCPTCGAGKDLFKSRSREVAGFAENQGYGFGTNTMTGEDKSVLIYGALAAFFALFIAGYGLE